MLFELEPGDDPAAFDRMPVIEWVTLRDPVTGDQQRVAAGLENIIKIFISVGYVVVEEVE